MTTESPGEELPEEGGLGGPAMGAEHGQEGLGDVHAEVHAEAEQGPGEVGGEPAELDEELGEVHAGLGQEAGEVDGDPGELDDEPREVDDGLGDEPGDVDEEPGDVDEELGEVDEAGDLYEADDLYEEPGEPGAAFEPSPMLQVVFINVEVFLPNTNPVMVLRELDDPFRELRITIGSPEGVAIAYGWRGIDTPKPLTHELFTEIFELFGLSLEVVRITGVRGAAYSGEIVVNGPQGTRVVQCRVSDAIALAVRQPLPVPIMVSPEVLDEVGSATY